MTLMSERRGLGNYMDSIVQHGKYCFLCGKNGVQDPLDEHHIFFGAGKRKTSEKYGLKVWLCHSACHTTGPYAVHNNRETREYLEKAGQLAAMRYYHWTVDDFRKVFGKNYLGKRELKRLQGDIEDV